MRPDCVGLLIVRAWVEMGSSAPLRARVRLTTDVSEGIQQELTLVEIEAVRTLVGMWLAEVVRSGLDDGSRPQ